MEAGLCAFGAVWVAAVDLIMVRSMAILGARHADATRHDAPPGRAG